MSDQRRIVVYGAAGAARDEELLDALVAATSLDRAALASQLAEKPVVYLPPLVEEAAGELAALLGDRGVDHDVEPYPPSPERAEWLAGEIPKWVKRGFLPAPNQAGLFWNYGLTPPAGEAAAPARTPRPSITARDPGFLVKAVLTIGAVLVGLGLILFIASNWQKIPSAVKIGGALALTLAALHTGHQLRYVRGPYPRLSATFLLIALFGIGGVCTLIAQVYHLTADTYLLPLVWGALCLPVAFLLRFQTALYFASALWLWSYWLYAGEHGHLPWYYAALLLGLLLPIAIATKDKFLYWTHVAVVLVALVSTLGTEDFWLATLWVTALVALAARDRRPLFDWILTAGFAVWAIAFFIRDNELPNAFYLLPLAWFFYRAWRRRDNWFLVVTVANAFLWWLTFVLHVIERWDLGEPTGTAFFLWMMGTGVLLYGAGRALGGNEWRLGSGLIRAGGAGLTLLSVYVMSFRFYERESVFFESPLLLLAALGSFVLGAGLVLRGSEVRPRRDELLLLALLALALGLAVALSPALGLHVALFNLILFAAALLLMLEGHHGQSLLWYNLGIGLFVILITTRYFDTFVDLLPRSVFFLLGGVFLIVWAVLVDRQRKRRALAPGATGGQGDA